MSLWYLMLIIILPFILIIILHIMLINANADHAHHTFIAMSYPISIFLFYMLWKLILATNLCSNSLIYVALNSWCACMKCSFLLSLQLWLYLFSSPIQLHDSRSLWRMRELQKKCGIEVGQFSSANCLLMPIMFTSKLLLAWSINHQSLEGEIAYILLPRSILSMAGIGTTCKGAAGMMPGKLNTKGYIIFVLAIPIPVCCYRTLILCS